MDNTFPIPVLKIIIRYSISDFDSEMIKKVKQICKQWNEFVKEELPTLRKQCLLAWQTRVAAINKEYKEKFEYIEQKYWMKQVMQHSSTKHIFNYRTPDLHHDHHFICNWLKEDVWLGIPFPDGYYYQRLDHE